MATMPVAKMPSFHAEPEKYGLYNPDVKFHDLMWGGKSIRIPGCHEVATEPCTFNDNDEPVPGTVIIKDSYAPLAGEGRTPLPGSAFNWKAADAIRNVLGIDIDTGQAHSTKAARGITFLPPVVDRDTFEAVKQDAERRFAESEVQWALDEVRGYEEALDKSKRAGVSAPPPDSGYNRAVVILAEHRKRTLGEAARSDEVISEADAEEIAGIEALAMEMAERAAKDKEVDTKKLASELMKKPEVRKHLQREYSIRKRGHVEKRE